MNKQSHASNEYFYMTPQKKEKWVGGGKEPDIKPFLHAKQWRTPGLQREDCNQVTQWSAFKSVPGLENHNKEYSVQ